MNIKPLSPVSKENIDIYIENFVSKYADGCQMFIEQGAKGLGTVEDLDVLGWMYYEGIYESEEEILKATAYILGKALVRYSGFEWREFHINSNSIIGVCDKSSKYFIPLIEFVLLKSYLLLVYTDNYDMDELFFDALYHVGYNERDEHMHPLFALEYVEEYQTEINFNLSSSIKPMIKKFWEKDSELLIRTLGLEFYKQFYTEDWTKIESVLKQIDLKFSIKYHKNNQWKPIYDTTEETLKIIDIED